MYYIYVKNLLKEGMIKIRIVYMLVMLVEIETKQVLLILH